MPGPPTTAEAATTSEMIRFRREVADLEQRIKNRRLQVFGLYATPVAVASTVLSWAGLKIALWRSAPTPDSVDNLALGLTIFFILATIAQFFLEFSKPATWKDPKTPVKNLRLDLELAEERRILEARRRTPPVDERQSSYKERLPAEINRLRRESRHYRRLNLLMQWVLFTSSAAITGVTAWYDPPQPGKGVLIALGFTVTVVTGAAGYFKPRERAFNLQQTADTMEQHITALELGIAPYAGGDGEPTLREFAAAVERIRAEQRLREQQLDQPQQGQQQVL
ncbi:SLATT domain-containing protein [Streptomyces showdoensis]|uniref:SLATT domain-containing protein n=1 Tax=Streptomyces showdoensis TaxID=68268 RepID=UPI001969E86F|nr:SLATT domain-containing protein [Streptomyces showdoensis]